MNTMTTACPHCGSKHGRLLADHVGMVGWCRECHRTWIAPAARYPISPIPNRPDRDDERQRRRIA